MTELDAWATALRLQRLAIILFKAETVSRATGKPLPADFGTTVALARATTRSFGLRLSTEQARRRFQSRYPVG